MIAKFPLCHTWVTLVVAATLCGCAASDTPAFPPRDTGLATQPYVIGPADHLGVFVYDNPQISVTDLPVRPDGRISLPLIQDIGAAGRTPAELSQDITKRLSRYVKAPNVTVMVHDFTGPFDRQIRVIGESASPQAIAYAEHMTLLDVMIQTKGLTRFAAGNRAVVIRSLGPGRQVSFRVRLADLIKDGDISQNVAMQPGDTLIIPQTWF